MVLPKCLKLNMLRYRLARATLRMEAVQAFSFSLRRAEGCLQTGKQQRQHSKVGGGWHCIKEPTSCLPHIIEGGRTVVNKAG